MARPFDGASYEIWCDSTSNRAEIYVYTEDSKRTKDMAAHHDFKLSGPRLRSRLDAIISDLVLEEAEREEFRNRQGTIDFETDRHGS